MNTALVLGGVSYDTIVHLDQFPQAEKGTIHARSGYETIGSTGAGKALSLKTLGFQVTLQGLIGDDVYGNKIKEYIEHNKIKFLYEYDRNGTERHVNLMNQVGERMSIFINSSSFDVFIDTKKIANEIKSSDVVVLNIINYCRHYISEIKRHKKEIWCDIHDYDGKNPYHKDFIEAADYLFMSSEHLPNYKSYMQLLIKQGKQLVICTHGDKGVTALTSNLEWYDLPIVDSYKQVDTNGAGDNFFAGFLYGYLKKESIRKCLEFGTITAGLCITSNELVSGDLSENKLLTEHENHYSNRKG